MDTNKEMLTVQEAAARLCVGEASIWTALRKGHLPSSKVGHARRIPTAAIEQMLASNANAT